MERKSTDNKLIGSHDEAIRLTYTLFPKAVRYSHHFSMRWQTSRVTVLTVYSKHQVSKLDSIDPLPLESELGLPTLKTQMPKLPAMWTQQLLLLNAHWEVN